MMENDGKIIVFNPPSETWSSRIHQGKTPASMEIYGWESQLS